MTCSFHVSLLFDLSIKLLSKLMILSSALMNSRFAVDFDLRERKKFRFSIFDLRRSLLWSYWVEWELILIIRLCSVTCWLIWYIICFDIFLVIIFVYCKIHQLLKLLYKSNNLCFFLQISYDILMKQSSKEIKVFSYKLLSYQKCLKMSFKRYASSL